MAQKRSKTTGRFVVDPERRGWGKKRDVWRKKMPTGRKGAGFYIKFSQGVPYVYMSKDSSYHGSYRAFYKKHGIHFNRLMTGERILKLTPEERERLHAAMK